MTHTLLPLAEMLAAPRLLFDYLDQDPKLSPFCGHFATIEAFDKQIETKKASFSDSQRAVLVQALTRQYAHIKQKPDLSVLAQPNTFTVTTGHQLNIFTGPLYVIYKIVTAINLAKQLKAKYPAYNFVPVYWMATEDHDFQEISSFNLFGKKYNWQTQQTGAVGRMNPRELGEAIKILPEKVPVFEKAYLKHNTLADAVRYYMNELFGNEGLVCVDGDDATLKAMFAPIIEDELLNQQTFSIVKKTTEELEKLGYEAIISPREINLFYLTEGVRERIIFENNTYKVLNTNLLFSKQEILDLVKSNPERFSPNVILRPVYEECILPNLAYIGGPSEVPYWLQLKGVFDRFDVPYPILMPRNFAIIITAAHQKRMEKLGLSLSDLQQDDTKLRKSFVEKNTDADLSLASAKELVNQGFMAILGKALQVDKTLEATVEAEKTKALAMVENLEKRLQKAEERHHETSINQVLGLKSKLFPNGSQERNDNFLNFALNDTAFISKLLTAFAPLDFRFNILIEEE